MRLVWWGRNINMWRFGFMRRRSSAPWEIYDWALQIGPLELRKWRTAD